MWQFEAIWKYCICLSQYYISDNKFFTHCDKVCLSIYRNENLCELSFGPIWNSDIYLLFSKLGMWQCYMAKNIVVCCNLCVLSTLFWRQNQNHVGLFSLSRCKLSHAQLYVIFELIWIIIMSIFSDYKYIYNSWVRITKFNPTSMRGSKLNTLSNLIFPKIFKFKYTNGASNKKLCHK